jgi:hypothetical protein
MLDWAAMLLGLYNLATPLASKSSVTVGSSPRMRRNCEGAPSGEASLSPLFKNSAGFAGMFPRLAMSGKFSFISQQKTLDIPICGVWHL